MCTAGTCSNTPSCDSSADCDDADACTTDTCDPANPAALEFDGTNDFLNLGNDGNSAAVNYLTNFGTGSCRSRAGSGRTTATIYMGLFRQGSQTAYPQVVVQFPGETPYNRIAGSVETSTTGTQAGRCGRRHVHPRPVVPTTRWSRTGRWGATLTVYLHDVAGTLVGSAQSNANVWATNPINDTYTGTPPNEIRDPALMGVARTPSPGANYNYYFDGRLDEVRIWSEARTAQQIQDSLAKQITSAPNLVHRWGMNEGSGTTTADSVGTATGTLINGPVWKTAPADIPAIGDGTCSHASIGGCCNTAAECDDEDACTTDSCNVYTPATRHPGVGECCSSADCDDGNACTDDACDVNNACAHTNNAASCDDGNVCTSGDACSGGTCQPGQPTTPPARTATPAPRGTSAPAACAPAADRPATTAMPARSTPAAVRRRAAR